MTSLTTTEEGEQNKTFSDYRIEHNYPLADPYKKKKKTFKRYPSGE